MKIRRALHVAVAAMIVAAFAALAAQVVAHQGEKAKEPEREKFQSPMVLEVPLQLERLPAHAIRDLGKLSRYWCEDAHLVGVKLAAVKVGKKESRFEVSGFVQVRESYDRLANVRVDLTDGEHVIASGVDAKIDAEERKATAFRLRLEVPREKVELLERAGDAARLVLTLTLRNNS